MTPETKSYAGLLLSHLRVMTHRLRQMSAEQWDWTPAPAAPTARQLAAHTLQWLVCDRQHIEEANTRRHALVPDLPVTPAAACDALEAETRRWQELLAGLTQEQLDAPRSQFNQYRLTVREFVCHIIQNTIYKSGQMATLFFAMGLDGTEPYDAPFPNPIYLSMTGYDGCGQQ